jgi:hypothetical protein
MRSMVAAFGVAVTLLSACGPGLGPSDRRAQAKSILESAASRPAEIEKLLRGTVVNGGMWWNHPDCVREFPVSSTIRPDRFSAFARCLAGLQLQPSTRLDSLPDVTVFHYEPGFEIEARIVEDGSGPRLAWIGYVGRSGPSDPLPTITPDALERLRLAGDRNGPLDPRTPGLEPLTRPSEFTWFKICLNADGAGMGLEPRQTTSPAVMRMFEAATTSWRFKPFVANGQAQPVCSMIRMRYPDAPLEDREVLPMPTSEGRPLMVASGALKLLVGEKMVVPDDRGKMKVQQSGVGRLVGVFRLCTDDTGKVVDLLPLRSTGLASYDQRILAATSKYVYAPVLDQGRAIPVCTIITFIYMQR